MQSTQVVLVLVDGGGTVNADGLNDVGNDVGVEVDVVPPLQNCLTGPVAVEAAGVIATLIVTGVDVPWALDTAMTKESVVAPPDAAAVRAAALGV